MRWDKYTIDTTTAAEDLISAMLAELGIEGVEIENNVPLTEEEAGGMFIDFPPELPKDDGSSRVSFYLEAGQDHEALLARVHAALENERQFMEIGSGKITYSQTEDADWMNNWKQFFHQFYIDDLLVIPSWEEVRPEDRDKKILHIDPGTAFGTGMHETTQLCIRQLRKYLVPGMKLLDVGTGSGILSIVGLKLGAEYALGTDLDPNAVSAAEENREANGIMPEQFQVCIGNIIEDRAVKEQVGFDRYDIVTANILADIIIPMAGALYGCLKQGGVLITSGIIDFKEQEVAKALTGAGFELLETNRQGEWVNLTARRN